MSYTNAQFRSILNGLGFSHEIEDSLRFPITDNNSPMNDWATLEGIRAFQSYFQLRVDGIVGPKTVAKAEQAMRILQADLNKVVQANLPSNQPFYGPKTTAAVKEFQRRYGFQTTGVAQLDVRKALHQFAHTSAPC